MLLRTKPQIKPQTSNPKQLKPQTSMKFLRCFAVAVALTLASCSSSKKLHVSTDASLMQAIDNSFQSDDAQYKLMMKNLPAGVLPKNYDPKTSKFETSPSGWWCSGFYTGTLLHLYEKTKDQQLYDEAIRTLSLLEKEKNNTGTHDLGFMMYCSFGNAERLAPKPEYRDILLQSAKSLSTRFNPIVGSIRSRNSKPTDYIVI